MVFEHLPQMSFASAVSGWMRVAVLLFGFSAMVPGAPLTWYVSAQSYFSPVDFTGSFTYDADTGVASNWNITVLSLGSLLTSFQGPHAQFCYTPPIPYGCVSDSFSSDNTFVTFEHTDTFYDVQFILNLVLSTPLSDSGGTIPLVPSGPPGPPFGNPPPGGSQFYNAFSGEAPPPVDGIASGSVSTVIPEPRTALEIALGCLLVASGGRSSRKVRVRGRQSGPPGPAKAAL